MERITYRTERLLLRPLEAEDRLEYCRVHEISADAFRPWSPAPEDDADLPTRFARALEQSRRGWDLGTHARFVAALGDTRIAGFFALNEIVRGVFQSAYLSWSVSADAWGRGLGTEGVTALLTIAFAAPPEGLGLHRVEAAIIPSNVRSVRVAEKVGLRHEGLAKRYLEIAGRWQDHERFAMTAEESQRG